MLRQRLLRRRATPGAPDLIARAGKLAPILRILFLAFLVLRLVTTVRQLRREIARIRSEGLVPQPA